MHITTMPNKETIRRICILNGASHCHLYIPESTTKVMLLTDIKDDKTSQLEEELESWCGMPFKVFSTFSKNKETIKILQKGDKILPIN